MESHLSLGTVVVLLMIVYAFVYSFCVTDSRLSFLWVSYALATSSHGQFWRWFLSYMFFMNLQPLVLFVCTDVVVLETSIFSAYFCFCLMSLVRIAIDQYCHSVNAMLNLSSSYLLSLICEDIMVCISFVLNSCLTSFRPSSYISLTNVF